MSTGQPAALRALDQDGVSRATDILAARDPALAVVRDRLGPPPLWKRPATFATFVRIILEQQVSLQSAKSTYDRLAARCGGRVSASNVAEIGREDLRALGFSRQKARYVNALAVDVVRGDFRIASLRHQVDQEVRRRITGRLGLGDWSADVFLLMALCRSDVLPVGDLALAKGISMLDEHDYESVDQLIERAEPWRPYRSVATRMVWQFYLDRNGQKIPS